MSQTPEFDSRWTHEYEIWYFGRRAHEISPEIESKHCQSRWKYDAYRWLHDGTRTSSEGNTMLSRTTRERITEASRDFHKPSTVQSVITTQSN